MNLFRTVITILYIQCFYDSITHVVKFILNSFLHISLALLCQQRLPYAKSYAAFIESLVGSNSRLNFIPNTEEQQTSLSTVDSYLSDQLI